MTRALTGLFTHYVVVIIILRWVNINSNRITVVLFVFVVVVVIIRVLVLKVGIQILRFCGRVGWCGSVVLQLDSSRRVSWLFLL